MSVKGLGSNKKLVTKSGKNCPTLRNDRKKTKIITKLV